MSTQHAPNRPLVMVSWDGRSKPLAMIHLDARPDFDWLVFDYSGQGDAAALLQRLPAAEPGQPGQLLCLQQATECKGELYRALAAHLSGCPQSALPSHVALIDDDILTSVSDMNRLLHLGTQCGLHVFSATLTHDSPRSHRFMLTQSQQLIREVDWVEVMMPVYDTALFMAAAPHFASFISSWGFDRYVFPAVQQTTGLTRTALMDSVVMSHRRAISSGTRRFANGLTAPEEADQLRQRMMSWLRQSHPALVATPWFQRCFNQRATRTPLERVKQGLGRPLRRWLSRSV